MKSNQLNDNAREYLIAILFGVQGMYVMQQIAMPESGIWINNVMDNELHYNENTELMRIQQISISNNQNVETLLDKLIQNCKNTKEKEYCKEKICQLINFGIGAWQNEETKMFLMMLASLVQQRLGRYIPY